MASTGFPKRGTRVIRKADGLIGEVYAIDPSKDLLTVRWAARPGHNTLKVRVPMSASALYHPIFGRFGEAQYWPYPSLRLPCVLIFPQI